MDIRCKGNAAGKPVLWRFSPTADPCRRRLQSVLAAAGKRRLSLTG
ncbi:MAG: hypothetical protein MJA29_03845 [Candidatus Omnitrophica bacterium]|nr:hypothetical protein [Candidatus Omnitrophota bacterium]